MADTPHDSGTRYAVTARKYRPQTFADLVAQEHVAETLRNAITHGRLAHAYLFSGPRGVGKTTAARILAKAVNCQTPLAERPDAEPCRVCGSCQAFEEGRSLNIIEIDAASNNRVEDIRELRDTVRVPPQGAKKKVYILDEVHMLSASAFNALLKTLEEPPDYALFIFATTEPHKVLPTILSRTQRFDFRRIAVPEIVARLEEISAAEGVTADDESLVLLARKGDGALRDALSVYDQAVSVCGPALEIGPLRQALGVVDADVYFDATDRARAGDRAGLLAAVDGVVRSGHDLAEFVQGLADHLRNLLVARTTGTGDLIEGTLATKERYLDAAQPYAEADLLHLLMLAEETAGALRESRQPRLTLELALLKMASLEGAADLDRLLRRLDALETAARTGTLPPSALTAPAPRPEPAEAPESASQAPASQSSVSAARPPDPAPHDAPSLVTQPATGPPAQGSAPARGGAAGQATRPIRSNAGASEAGSASGPATGGQATDPSASYTPRSAAAPPEPARPRSVSEPRAEPAAETFADAHASSDRGHETPPADSYEPDRSPSGPPPAPPGWDDEPGGEPSPRAPRPTPPQPTPQPPAGADPPAPPPAGRPRPVFGRPALRRSSGGDGQTGPALAATGDGQTGPAPAAPVASADPLGPALAAVTDAWGRFVDAVRDEVGIRVGAIVKSGSPYRVARGAVEVAMDDAFGVRVATDNAERLAEVLAAVLGAPAPPLRWVEAPTETAETTAQADPFEALKQMRQSHPVVRALFESFGAEIVWQ